MANSKWWIYRGILMLSIATSMLALAPETLAAKAPKRATYGEVVNEDNVVNVIVSEKPVVATESMAIFQKLGITGLVLIDKDGAVYVINPKGASVDLCGPKKADATGDRRCKLDTTLAAFISAASSTADVGECYPTSTSATTKSCHKTGDYAQKYKYHSSHVPPRSHRSCYSPCD